MVKFREMLKLHNIVLPKNVCNGMSEESINRMIDMTLKMERPLTNALGKDWENVLTRDKIRELYLKM